VYAFYSKENTLPPSLTPKATQFKRDIDGEGKIWCKIIHRKGRRRGEVMEGEVGEGGGRGEGRRYLGMKGR
jgi:hypothetical protein